MTSYKIHASFDLSMHDHKVLSLLYLPLIGQHAYSLYTTLYAWQYQSTNAIISQQQLIDHLNVKAAEVLSARHVLEAFDLVNTYTLDENQYLVKLKKPLTPKQFLSDTIFGSFYASELGESHAQTMIQLFEVKQPKITELQNISKAFDDVYRFKNVSKFDVSTSLYENGGQKRSKISASIPYDSWFESLPKRYQKPPLLRPSIRETIENIAFVYDFTLEDLTEVIKRLAVKDLASKQAINLQARLYFEETRHLDVDKKDVSIEDQLSTISPLYILKKYSKTNMYGLALETVSALTERNHVDMGIINTILLFVLKRKDGILPNVNYLEKILHDWLNRGVKTTADATKLAKEIEEKYKKSTYYKQKPKAVEPDWLEDYLKELENVEELV